VIVVSEQEPMNAWGRLCQVINQRLSGSLGPGKIMTFVVNPASFQSDCARRNLVPMKLGTSHWSCVGVGVGVNVAVAVAVAVGIAVAVGVEVGLGAGVGDGCLLDY
jgi:hypothetical protein